MQNDIFTDRICQFCTSPGLPVNGTVVEYACDQGTGTVGEWYLDYSDVKFGSSQRLTCTNNGTWETNLQTDDFCPLTGQGNTCTSPLVPDCHDRSIHCLSSPPNMPDMERFDVTPPGTELGHLGSAYIYRCINRGNFRM